MTDLSPAHNHRGELGPLERRGAVPVAQIRGVGLLAREPVRVHLYGVLTAVVALLVYYGVTTSDAAELWAALAAAVLAVPVVETVRGKVTPATRGAR